MTTKVGNTGITKVVEMIAQNIDDEEIHIDYIFPNTPSVEFSKVLADRRSDYYILDNRKTKTLLLYIINLVRIMRKNRYDIVHIHANSRTATIELIAAKIARVRCRIVHAHSTSTNYRMFHEALKIPFEMALTYGFASSQDAGNWLFSNDNYSVLPTGINTDDFKFSEHNRKKLRKELNLIETDILLGHVGMFTENKNQKFLLNLLALLKKNNKNFKLIFIGEGAMKNECEFLAKQLGVSDSVIFYGESNKANEMYAAMDYFVFPSYSEGFGLALLEAQASNLKCFASNSVPTEVDVSGDVTFFELSADKKVLMNLINEEIIIDSKNRSEKKNFEVIKNSKYDSYYSIQEIVKLYNKLYKENR